MPLSTTIARRRDVCTVAGQAPSHKGREIASGRDLTNCSPTGEFSALYPSPARHLSTLVSDTKYYSHKTRGRRRYCHDLLVTIWTLVARSEPPKRSQRSSGNNGTSRLCFNSTNLHLTSLLISQLILSSPSPTQQCRPTGPSSPTSSPPSAPTPPSKTHLPTPPSPHPPPQPHHKQPTAHPQRPPRIPQRPPQPHDP